MKSFYVDLFVIKNKRLSMLSIIKKNVEFSKVLLVYSFWIASAILAGTLFEIYFFGLGLSIQDIYLSSLFWFISAPLAVYLFKGFETRKFMLAGISIAIIGVGLLYFFVSPDTAYIFRFLIGMPNFFFWVPFNVLFYEFKKENHAFLGAIYYSTSPVLCLFLPALAGVIAQNIGYNTLFAISGICYAITFALVFAIVKKKEYSYDLKNALKSISGLRTLIFLEGFGPAVIVLSTIEIMLLKYANTPLQFGSFISLVTIFSIVASLITAKISDRLKHRRYFILAVVLLLGLSVMATSFASDLESFFLGVGLVSLFRTIFFPLPLALTVDNSKSLVDTMVGREFVLGLGRLSGVIFGIIVLTLSNIETVLFLQGLAILLYIPVFEIRKKKLAKH